MNKRTEPVVAEQLLSVEAAADCRGRTSHRARSGHAARAQAHDDYATGIEKYVASWSFSRGGA